MASACDYTVLRGLPSSTDVPYVAAPNASQGSCQADGGGFQRYFGASVHGLAVDEEDGFPSDDASVPPDTLAQYVANMQMAIMTDGPIVAGFNVYTDFYYYPSLQQVYTRLDSFTVGGQTQTNSYEGGHAIVIVGWGLSEDTPAIPYWICQNSWSTGFGYAGFFYIQRGINLCNIELDPIGVIPDLTGSPRLLMPAASSAAPPVASVASLASDAATDATTSSDDAWGIALIVVGSVVIVLALAFMVYMWYAPSTSRLKKLLSAHGSNYERL